LCRRYGRSGVYAWYRELKGGGKDENSLARKKVAVRLSYRGGGEITAIAKQMQGVGTAALDATKVKKK
jgi:hypothetical protein